MTCDSELVIFKSNINSAMGNQIPWDVLVTLMKEICSTFEKSLAVNDVLLDELKTFIHHFFQLSCGSLPLS